ncbi:hypothetical protein BBP40_004004 [Aspergillus hancockii]|nr:hypothetical protein BBP40_004004 [Aspergillus hancockii]
MTRDLSPSDLGESTVSSSVYSVHSEQSAEAIPSETSDDRAFVISDSEQVSDGESSEDNIVARNMSLIDPDADGVTTSQDSHARDLRPIRIIAKRSIVQDGEPVIQYLVLWCSWETTEEVLATGIIDNFCI